jgi:putative heme-binding domain-containing protein
MLRMRFPRGRVLAWCGALLALGGTGLAQTPQWIWSAGPVAEGGDDVRWFRRAFRTPPYTWNARLTVSADASAEVFLNGKPVAVCERWDRPLRAEVSVNLRQGENVLAVRARAAAGRAGLLVHLHLGGAHNDSVLSDGSWRVSRTGPAGWADPGFNEAGWESAVSLGAHGIPPWGDVLQQTVATPAEGLQVPPGFRAELLRSAAPGEGSWVCLAFDDRGRLIVSPEGDAAPLLRLAFAPDGQVGRVEPIAVPLRFAMGLLFARGSLYANAKGPRGSGLHRLTDTNGNDRFEPDELRLLKEFEGGGEHGYHGLALGPDDRIYVLNGNMTRLPAGVSPNSPHRRFAEDVLSLNPDETSKPQGALVPGCQVLRTDLDGGHWELFAAGMRNAYDLDFSPDGELFTLDSDNEWDWGLPWYRPTRLYHVVSGAEMGWRDGTRAWPDEYPDQVRGVVDVGLGSPCGVEFGTRARFPERYRRALFVQDWSYGRILAVHLEASGAGYTGAVEPFLKGQPLNLTAMTFGPDGAMYFVTGGRGTQSGLYRVSYTNALAAAAESRAPVPPGQGTFVDAFPLTPALSPGGREGVSPRSELPGDPGAAGMEARATRRRLESFQGRDDPAALSVIWPYLGSADATLRYAARVALESQAVDRWRSRALGETHTVAALTALLALARVDAKAPQPGLFEALMRFPLPGLDPESRLWKLRVLQLSLLRQGRPPGGLPAGLLAEIDTAYPARTWPENRELARLLIFLEAPGVVVRTLALIEQAQDASQQVHYVAQLRRLRSGWTVAERARYFGWWLQPRAHLRQSGALLRWFADVGREFVEGANFDRQLGTFRREAITALTPAERESLGALLDDPVASAPLAPARPRSLVREWTLAELLPALPEAAVGRDFERGRQAFLEAQCLACHRFGNLGGAVGPELTAVASKYDLRSILESLIEPSKVVSEQFQNVNVFLKDGDTVTGRLLRQGDQELVVETDPLQRVELTLARTDVEEVRPSTVSPMPEGLLHPFQREEILDLLAFLASGGRRDAAAFRKLP